VNGFERIEAVLRGRWPDRVPVMLHNFMLAAHEAGVTMERYRNDARAIARCFIEAIERYGYDGIVVDVDTATLAGALGAPVDFPADAPARSSGGRLRALDEVDELETPDVARYPGVQVWLEATALVREHFGNEVYIRGNCDQAPYSLAALVRSPEAWMMDLTEPENQQRAHRLLAHCAQATAQFIRLMAQTGAHMVSNGDSLAGPELVSPKLYREFALPYEKQIVELAHELARPYFLHICGKTDRILQDMVSTGADGLELDYRTDIRLAHELLRDNAVFIGNLDPSGLLASGTPTMVEEKARELMGVFADTPRLILNAGCAIPPTTPPENIRALMRAARQGP